MTRVIQVVTTTAEKDQARKIATSLVEQRLAACVQITGPIESIYRWQGQVETSSEWLCTIKTVHGLYPRVEQAIRELHDYDEPEILAVPVVEGSPSYLQWVGNEVVDPLP